MSGRDRRLDRAERQLDQLQGTASDEHAEEIEIRQLTDEQLLTRLYELGDADEGETLEDYLRRRRLPINWLRLEIIGLSAEETTRAAQEFDRRMERITEHLTAETLDGEPVEVTVESERVIVAPPAVAHLPAPRVPPLLPPPRECRLVVPTSCPTCGGADLVRTSAGHVCRRCGGTTICHYEEVTRNG